MQYGSVFGHGAYLGPDFTADYLRRASDFVRRQYGGPTPTARPADRRRLPDNRYDSGTGLLELSAAQAQRLRAGGRTTRASSREPSPSTASRPTRSPTAHELTQLTAFFGWTAWAASADRPGPRYSYTNNWPPEPRVQNRPTGAMVVWSVLSLIALLGGIGLLFAAFGRWALPRVARARGGDALLPAPGEVALTPGQRTTAWFFLVMAALFLVQTLVGAASQHYRAELSSFFGFDLAHSCPST